MMARRFLQYVKEKVIYIPLVMVFLTTSSVAVGAVYYIYEGHEHVWHQAPTDEYGCHYDETGYYHCH